MTGPSRLKNLEPVFGTPLRQRCFNRVGFKRIPALENAISLQQILEARVGSLPPEKSLDLVVTRRQILSDKAQDETSSKIELILMRYRKVVIRSFKVVGMIFVECVVEIRGLIDLVSIE